MNRFTRLIFFGIVLVIAFVVSYNVYNRMTSPTETIVREAGPATTNIAVAVRDLGRGDKIATGDVNLVSYLEKTLPPGHFTTTDAVVGRVVLTPIVVSQPLLESNLAPKDITKGGMAAFINHQKRAMAVQVDNVIGVAGFLQPGHLVDVLVSINPPVDNARARVTKTVLENIPVLAVGTQDQESEDRRPRQVTVVTLEVSLEEGEKLSLAVTQGSIQLALRNYSDFDPVQTEGATVEKLLASLSPDTAPPANPVASAPTASPPPVRQPIVVEVMNGNSIREVRINR